MKNWKHSMSAVMAVVMVGSLATVQVKDMSAVFADKNNEEISVEIPKEEIVNKAKELETEDSQKVKETSDEIAALNKVEVTKAYEPKLGYVIATAGMLNVREEKDTDSKIIAKLNPGSELWLIGEYEDWYMISVTVNGAEKKGFVSKEFVTASYTEAKDILLDEMMYEKSTVAAGMELKSAPDSNAFTMEVFEKNEEVIIISETDTQWSKIYTTDDYTVGYVLNAGLIPNNKMVLREDVVAARSETMKAIGVSAVVYGTEKTVVKAMPQEDAEDKDTLKSGTSCLMIKGIGEWTMISYGTNYATGYVKTEYLMTKEAYDVMKAEEERKRLEEEQKKKAEEEQKRKAEQAAKAEKSSAKTNSTLKTTTQTTTQNVPQISTQTTTASSSKGQQIVNTASKYIGVRYVYGGTTPSGFDCSGLVQYVCREVGISVNRSSRDQYRNGVAVAKSDLQPGDLVFFAKGSSISHVAIYAGNGEVIHAPRPGKSVCRIKMSYLTSSSKYVGARRVY